MNPSVLILGKEDDLHIGLVKPYLGEEPTILDVGAVERGLTFSYDGTSDAPLFIYDGQQIDLSAFKSVWYRQINLRKMRHDLVIEPPEQYEYALSAHTQQNEAIMPFINPNAFWVSKRDAIRRAELKPLQLAVARKAGFRHILPTLFTSSAAEARQFVAAHGRCVVKPISLVMPRGEDQHTIVTDGTDISFEGLHLTPHIFQPALDPVVEVRVGVVGNAVFASEVLDTDGDDTSSRMRDYRLAFGKGTFLARPYKLPQRVIDACIKYRELMGLAAGFADLIVDNDGNYWFIEWNPNGEWGFMDEMAMNGLAREHARVLQSALVA